MLYKSFLVLLYFYLWYLNNFSFVNSIRLTLSLLSFLFLSTAAYLRYLSIDVILCNHLLYLTLLFFLCVIV